MTDDTQAADTTSDAEPSISETLATPAEAPEKKKSGRGARSMKAAKPAKATRARRSVTVEEVGAPTPEAAAEPVATVRKTRGPARKAKALKPAEAARGRRAAKSPESVAPAPELAAEPVAKTAGKGKTARATTAKAAKSVKASKVAKSAEVSKRAKTEKTVEVAKVAKVVKTPSKAGASARKTAVRKAASNTATGREKGARYTTNELSSAVRKAGLTVEFTPVVTKTANIGRGPAKEFKVDAMIARLRGSNGELISGRGPGTPLYNDVESLAAVEIFEKFRDRTFHNKLKVEVL